MTGKPAARIGDKVVHGKIACGAALVVLGVAWFGLGVCACKGSPACGGPVNPMLGIKLLPDEIDFALPAPSPFVFARSYASDDARIGPLGPGWSIPGAGVAIESSPEALILIDQQGRRITFEPLAPGEEGYSATEMLELRRGGPIVPQVKAFEPWTGRWAAVPENVQRDPDCLFIESAGNYHHFQRRHGRWRLIAQFDRNGYRTQFNWAPEGELRSFIDSAGRRYRFVYHDHAEPGKTARDLRLAGIALDGEAPFDPSDPATHWLVRYTYDETGQLTEVIDRNGRTVRRFDWDGSRMIAHHDHTGRSVRYRWNGSGSQAKVIEQHESGGLTRHYAYNHGCTEVTDSLGRVERYHHQGQGGERRWTALERADGSRIEFQYDWAGRRVGERDPLGREHQTGRNGGGQITAEIGPDGARTDYDFDELGDLIALTDAERRCTRFERDTRGNLVKETGPDGAITRTAYANPRLPDRPTQITDARGGVKHLEWTPLGQLAAYTDCSGKTTRYTYDDDGRLTTLTDALGHTWRAVYDTHGQLTEQTAPDGATTRYSWDRADRLLTHSDPAGNTSQLHYDEHGRLIQVTDPNGHTRRLAYDTAGRLTTLINENAVATRFTWDILDRLVEEHSIDERTRHYRYNAADELIEIEETSAGQTRSFRFERNKAGRLIARQLPPTDSSPTYVERLRYNRAGQLTEAHNKHCAARWTYDQAGRIRAEAQEHTDGWTWQLAHRRGALGLIEASHYGDAPAIDWLTYGPGHLHGLRIDQQTLEIERDSLHREIGRATAHWAVQRDYDAAGRLTAWHLNGAGRSDTQPGWLRQYQYDATGRPVNIEDSRYGAIGYRYDPAGRLIGSRHGQSEQRYAFDAAGNRLSRSRAEPAQTWAAEVRARLPDTSFNVLRGDHAGQARGWPDNRVLELDGSRYAYDAWGNLTERIEPDGAKLELTWDGADRLVSLWRRDANGQITEARYAYDALGRRIRKDVTEPDGASTTRFGWEGDRQVTEDIDGQLTRTTVYEPDSFVPVARIEMRSGAKPDSQDEDDDGDSEADAVLAQMLGQVKHMLLSAGLALPKQLTDAQAAQAREARVVPRIGWFHTDHLGTPLALADSQGQLLWYGQPDDWGAVAHTHGSVTQPIRFQGQFHDAESGLYYNRHRYYDARMARYLSQDPIGLVGGINIYQYAYAMPTIAYDPTGLLAPLAVIAVMALIGGLTGGGVNVVKQKYIDKKCEIEWLDAANSAAWGAVGGAAMPIAGTTVLGAATVGGATGLGQYATGSVINGEGMTIAGAAINTGAGAVGGGLGGTFKNVPWYGTSKTGLPQVAAKQQTAKNIQANTTSQTIGQGAGGSLVGNTTEVPCLTCKRKCP